MLPMTRSVPIPKAASPPGIAAIHRLPVPPTASRYTQTLPATPPRSVATTHLAPGPIATARHRLYSAPPHLVATPRPATARRPNHRPATQAPPVSIATIPVRPPAVPPRPNPRRSP